MRFYNIKFPRASKQLFKKEPVRSSNVLSVSLTPVLHYSCLYVSVCRTNLVGLFWLSSGMDSESGCRYPKCAFQELSCSWTHMLSLRHSPSLFSSNPTANACETAEELHCLLLLLFLSAATATDVHSDSPSASCKLQTATLCPRLGILQGNLTVMTRNEQNKVFQGFLQRSPCLKEDKGFFCQFKSQIVVCSFLRDSSQSPAS